MGSNARFTTAVATKNTRTTSSVSSAYTVLMSVLAFSVTLSLISSCLGIADAVNLPMDHRLSQRSFKDIKCNGIYDTSIFARLERLCEDCYNLFREPQLYGLCRQDCYSGEFFAGCIEVLLLQDEKDELLEKAEYLRGSK